MSELDTKPGISTAARSAPPADALRELTRALRAVDPRAVLILPRLLRRVIAQDCSQTGWGHRIPHRKSYVVSRERLLRIVAADELGAYDPQTLPTPLILLAQPDADQLAATPWPESLTRCWRLLFHARVHLALDEAAEAGRLSEAVVRQRIDQLGAAAFDEIRHVLRAEAFLLPPQDERSVYIEFAAVYCELRHFAPSLVASYFPSLDSEDAADRVLAQDLDAAGLWESTRPPGCADPVDVALAEFSATPEAFPDGPDTIARWFPWDFSGDRSPPPAADPQRYRRLIERAERAESLANVVRGLICRTQALRYADPQDVARTTAAIREQAEWLMRRLQRAIGIHPEHQDPWREAILTLLPHTTRGFWPPESRLLYDLQKVCVDAERAAYTVDPVGWLLAGAQGPLRRELPSLREVLIATHLRSAAERLPAVRLTPLERRQLSVLLEHARQHAEDQLREELRPKIHAVLDAVELQPGCVAERVARAKIVEELLDRVAERGHLSLGEVRDALSRNQLKLRDFGRPGDLRYGDELLRADRRLARQMDGAYRRGEFYLRWMHRLSYLAFATPVGRFLTRFVAVPFGGAYLAVGGIEHLVELVTRKLFHHRPDVVHHAAVHVHHGPGVKHPAAALVLGLLLMLLLNSRWFRRNAREAAVTTGKLLNAILVRPIVALVRAEWLQAILRSRFFFLLTRFLFRPLALTVPVYLLVPEADFAPQSEALFAASLFLAINVLINSRVARTMEEVLSDWLVQSWHRFGIRILAGLFWLTMDLFKRLLEGIERLLYTVDEWLRFRHGESRFSFAAKAVLGVVWFFVAYVVRFCVTLLIEPQVNPIKHFPVVTVGHKLMLPFIPTLAGVLSLTMDKGLAITVATTIIAAIPGIFGFLVWELREDWRLYAANRPRDLEPLLIGSHGETLTRLMRPGFHSGTLPRIFGRLRRADRKARRSGQWRDVRKQLHLLEHVELAVRRYVERELTALLAETAAWAGQGLGVAHVRLGGNRMRIEIGRAPTAAQPAPGDPLELSFELQAATLCGRIARPGWISGLSAAQRQTLANALLGLHKTAGTELIAEQVTAVLALRGARFRVTDDGLVVAPRPDADDEMVYPLDNAEAEDLIPRPCRSHMPAAARVLRRSELVYTAQPLTWEAWCHSWDAAARQPTVPPLLPTRVLPEPS